MRIMIRIAAGAVASAICLAAVSPAAAQNARQIMENARRLAGQDAIDERKIVKIGGINQWIFVRDRHRSNPILLFLHGGPSFTVSPVRYWYMRDREEYFTVVQWDQRGAGKTYAANDTAARESTRQTPGVAQDSAHMTCEEEPARC